ncbi:MAG: double-strand break repair helicase AddA [Alphaproteobacteria bacterium]
MAPEATKDKGAAGSGEAALAKPDTLSEPATLALARRTQTLASSPTDFAWVSANAGSGKTHVLVNRLARLLIAGTEPSRILCLTFTKAAAAEMANRLFDRLAGWAVAPDQELIDELTELSGQPPEIQALERARQLFALALESPGGLKIYTIHAFCERVLHRFPLEAGVAPNFTVADAQTQSEMLSLARRQMLDDAAAAPNSPLALATQTLSTLTHDMKLDQLLGDLVRRRRAIGVLCDENGRFDASLAVLAAHLGVDPATSEADIIDKHLGGSSVDAGMAERVAQVLRGGSTKDIALTAPFMALAGAVSPRARLAAFEAAFLTKDKSKVRALIMTKDLRAKNFELAQWIDTHKERASQLRGELGGVRTLSATAAILTVAEATIARYEEAKKAQSRLDFDDLVTTTCNLLSNGEDTAWVLYKLDGGIDHILVDEAQDTSPAQWDIVRYLAEDLLAGEGARSVQRTVFAVGDEKQSIFSFQGAAPEMFAQMRQFFGDRAQAAQRGWQDVQLHISFRSTPEILGAVDRVFAQSIAASSLTASGARPRHIAHRTDIGLVEIWPVVEPVEDDAGDFWMAREDYAPPFAPRRVLARKIAQEIAGWLSDSAKPGPGGQPIRPGDILVLVRRRNDFVDALVRELKNLNVPVAGVDRMRLATQIVVQDLIALARFALLPQDDLNLAILLKSPLVGLDEQTLFDLAQGRPASLWEALRAGAAQNDTLKAAEQRLSKWLDMADFLPPFEFFADILASGDNRARIFARLGIEAADPIEEFLIACLTFAQSQLPTLEGFLAWMARDDIEIKRDMEHGKNEVRVMTVHGAKGLEANIVILPDTCAVPSASQRPRLREVILPGAGEFGEAAAMPVWSGAAKGVLPLLDEAQATRDEREMREHNRLAYVAMTRARDWLIVCGYQGKKKRDKRCWYDLIAQGLGKDLEPYTAPNGDQRQRFVLHRDVPPPTQPTPQDAPPAEPALPEPPAWVRTRAPVELPTMVLRPSQAEVGPASITDRLSPLSEARGRRFTRGRLIHALLERLATVAPEQRASAADTYLAAVAADLGAEMRARLREEVLGVFETPAFAPFLEHGARAEVPFWAQVENPFGGPALTISGQVDRLAHGDGAVHVLDFKTHRPAARTLGEIAPDIVRQLALYSAAFAVLFAGKKIVMSVLWTDGARLMTLPGEMLDEAFQAAAHQAGDNRP